MAGDEPSRSLNDNPIPSGDFSSSAGQDRSDSAGDAITQGMFVTKHNRKCTTNYSNFCR